MIYSFNVTYTNLMEKNYCGTIDVELSDAEAEVIAKSVDTSLDIPHCVQLRRGNKKIYRKILEETKVFAYYSDLTEARRLGLFTDICCEDINMDTLLEEDKLKGFYPYDEFGRKLTGDALHEQWYLWEADRLKGLSYRQWIEYYNKRFNVYLGDYKQICLSFDLPQLLIDRCNNTEHQHGVLDKIKNLFNF